MTKEALIFIANPIGAIIAALGNPTTSDGYAAQLARDYSDGVYHDWYLPSRDELVLMSNIGPLGANISVFQSAAYWSSSSDIDNKVWVKKFSSGATLASLDNILSNLRHVRAIRAF